MMAFAKDDEYTASNRNKVILQSNYITETEYFTAVTDAVRQIFTIAPDAAVLSLRKKIGGENGIEAKISIHIDPNQARIRLKYRFCISIPDNRIHLVRYITTGTNKSLPHGSLFVDDNEFPAAAKLDHTIVGAFSAEALQDVLFSFEMSLYLYVHMLRYLATEPDHIPLATTLAEEAIYGLPIPVDTPPLMQQLEQVLSGAGKQVTDRHRKILALLLEEGPE